VGRLCTWFGRVMGRFVGEVGTVDLRDLGASRVVEIGEGRENCSCSPSSLLSSPAHR